MILNGRVIDRQYITTNSLYFPGRITGAIKELQDDFEQEIKASGETPHFLLTDSPTEAFSRN